jgi:hypothetical protein
MANQEKHPKNPVVEWLEGEKGTVPASSRISHLVNAYIKRSKSAVKKYRPAELRNNPTLYPPPEVMQRGEWWETPPAALQRLRDRLWTEIKSA